MTDVHTKGQEEAGLGQIQQKRTRVGRVWLYFDVGIFSRAASFWFC